jgi:hypothetical protein
VVELGISKRAGIPLLAVPTLVNKVVLAQRLGEVLIPVPVVATPVLGVEVVPIPVLGVEVVLTPVLLLKPPLKP